MPQLEAIEMTLDTQTSEGYPLYIKTDSEGHFLCAFGEPETEIRVDLGELVHELKNRGFVR